MPRQARLDVPGALHHIMVRGINKSKIFKDDQDKRRFLDRLGQTIDSSEELGLSGAEIARHLGVNTSSVNRAIARADESVEK